MVRNRGGNSERRAAVMANLIMGEARGGKMYGSPSFLRYSTEREDCHRGKESKRTLKSGCQGEELALFD